MILGNDISNYQTVDWSVYKNNTNFVIIKATEGVGFTDAKFSSHRTGARTNNVPLGYYHFARPDLGNSAVSEANWFCSVLDGGGGLQQGEVLALDFEVSYADRVNWCKSFLDTVSNHYGGIKPMIYINQSTVSGSNWSTVVNAGYKLWLACYTGNPNNNACTVGQWGSMIMQQWTSSQSVPGIGGGVDGNAFFGTINDYKAMGFNGGSSPSSTPSPSPSRSPSRSPSPSPSPSAAISPSPSSSVSLSRSASPSATATQSSSPSKSPSATPSPSSSVSLSPSPSPAPDPGNQIIAVSKGGKNVLSATDPNDFIFHSQYNSLKIVAEGIFTVNLNAGTIDTRSFDHGLGYTPLVEGFCKVDSEDRAVCTFEGMDTYPFRYFFYHIASDSTKIYVKLKNDDSSLHQFKIKFYIFEVPF